MLVLWHGSFDRSLMHRFHHYFIMVGRTLQISQSNVVAVETNSRVISAVAYLLA
jgi:hypothetical protein